MGVTIKDYPMYEIFDNGTVFSHFSNKFLKSNVSSNGYASVELFNEKGSKRLLVHRLVADAYIPNPDNLPCVNHRDEVRSNNNAENLEWCTHKYNSNYGSCKEKIKKNRKLSPDKLRKFYEAGVMAHARRVVNESTGKEFRCVSDVGNFYGINKSHISEVCKGKRKSAGGFRWKYKE